MIFWIDMNQKANNKQPNERRINYEQGEQNETVVLHHGFHVRGMARTHINATMEIILK